MNAYYNENNPFAAAWLRELIKKNLIAEGEVDERSIREVRPDELKKYTQCHFFAGIGVWSYALRNAGWPDDRPVWTGSCPCQPFSTAGKRKGFSDDRHLWPEWFKLIDQCRPVAIFGEQVASKDGLTWLDIVSSDLEKAGYACGSVDTCAAGFGAPHVRQRLYFAAKRLANTRVSESRGLSDSRWQEMAEIGSGSQDGGMAYSKSDRARNDESQQERRPSSIIEPYSKTDGVADSRCVSGTRRGELRDVESTTIENKGTSQEWKWVWDPIDDSGTDGELANAEGRREESTQQPGQLCSIEQGCELGNNNNNSSGLEGRRWFGANQGGDSSDELFIGPPSFVNGFWADADWLPCIDGKARPVEPGTFPLAHGSPNRVGRLRGYGNALVAPQAQGFIEAYIKTEKELKTS